MSLKIELESFVQFAGCYRWFVESTDCGESEALIYIHLPIVVPCFSPCFEGSSFLQRTLALFRPCY